jgi:hypothetical protein
MKKLFFLTIILLSLSSEAQVSESCDCTVDTLGYANFVKTLTVDEEVPFNLHIHNKFAVAIGVIDGNTPSKIQNLIDNHSEVTTIVMLAVPGSMDDESNLQASQLIHNNSLKMYLPKGGFVASGGTDMLLAGSIRVVEVTTNSVGVHSWAADANGNVTATDFPVGHANHLPYINYYTSIGFSQSEAESFYYFTINSAPFSGVHWMTEQELDTYKVRSCRYSNNPQYSVSVKYNLLKADLSNKSYQWIDCSTKQAIPNSTDQTFYPSVNGEYAVIVSESNCQDTSACVAFNSLSNKEQLKEGIHVFWDKGNEKIHLEFDNTPEYIEVRLYDIQGKILAEWRKENVTQFELISPRLGQISLLEIITPTQKKVLKLLN